MIDLPSTRIPVALGLLCLTVLSTPPAGPTQTLGFSF